MAKSPKTQPSKTQPIVIGVHGFNFDPRSRCDNPAALYESWSKMLGVPVRGFAWYSSTPTLMGVLRAWVHGFWERYAYAYHVLAEKGARDLVKVIDDAFLDARGPVSIVCHSLGSRVVLRALSMIAAGRVARVLILDGAELRIMVPRGFEMAKILNVCVRHDRVLKDLGSWASGARDICIGYAGLGRACAGWTDLFLDDKATQEWALAKHEWGLNAVDPLDPAGHWESYRIEGNWPLYRHFIRGDDVLKGLPDYLNAAA
jgi:hypothetical protein